VSIGFIGASHASAPLALRDRLAVDGGALDRLLDLLRDEPSIAEAAVLSTCNRTEIYLVAPDTRAASARATTHLLAVAGVSPAETEGLLEQGDGRDAVRRLFAVAAGLSSLVPGETQILTQVREAFAYAAARDIAGPELGLLARAAVTCGKRVRAETSFGTTDTSVSAVAIAVARARLGGLAGRTALLIGAGAINRVSADLLRAAGIGEIVVVSRTRAAAADLAVACDGRDEAIEELPDLLAAADLAIAATRAPAPLIVPATVRPRDVARPLLLLDIAAPRDVDPAVDGLAGVTVIDMDGLRAVSLAEAGGEGFQGTTGFAAAEALVDACVERYAADARARRAVPLIAGLRAHVDRQKDAELARTLSALGHLPQEDQDEVSFLAHRLVNRMFHHLATRLKSAAAEPDGDAYLAALSYLFDGSGTEYRTVMAPPSELGDGGDRGGQASNDGLVGNGKNLDKVADKG